MTLLLPPMMIQLTPNHVMLIKTCLIAWHNVLSWLKNPARGKTENFRIWDPETRLQDDNERGEHAVSIAAVRLDYHVTERPNAVS